MISAKNYETMSKFVKVVPRMGSGQKATRTKGHSYPFTRLLSCSVRQTNPLCELS